MTQSAKPAYRPRRSVLYMPGSNARALEKAKSIPADALILDLEDAVAPDAKADARAQVVNTVKEGGYGLREIIIRVNGLDTEWGEEDVRAAVSAKPAAVLVPKVDDAAAVERYEALIDEGDASGDVALWAMMETPKAMLNAETIAAASQRPGSRLSAWVMGTNDLVKETGIVQTADRYALITSLSLCLLAARAYNLIIIDGVYNDIKNESGYEAICQQGMEMGFDGKTLIHPSQVEACNRIFSPTEEEVSFARQVIEAFEQPENQNKGAIKVDGRMVELLHAEIAKKTVSIADAISELDAAHG